MPHVKRPNPPHPIRIQPRHHHGLGRRRRPARRAAAADGAVLGGSAPVLTAGVRRGADAPLGAAQRDDARLLERKDVPLEDLVNAVERVDEVGLGELEVGEGVGGGRGGRGRGRRGGGGRVGDAAEGEAGVVEEGGDVLVGGLAVGGGRGRGKADLVDGAELLDALGGGEGFVDVWGGRVGWVERGVVGGHGCGLGGCLVGDSV